MVGVGVRREHVVDCAEAAPPEVLRDDGLAHAARVAHEAFSLFPPRVARTEVGPPASVEGARAASSNDDSLVLRVSYGRRCFLLTGDIEARSERALVAAADPLRCDVVKVAHHGSRTSSTESFVAAASPAVAVVSVGTESPYGHPHPEVLKRWREGAANVLTTGVRGTITVSTDGEDLKLETFVKE